MCRVSPRNGLGFDWSSSARSETYFPANVDMIELRECSSRSKPASKRPGGLSINTRSLGQGLGNRGLDGQIYILPLRGAKNPA